MVLGPFPLPQDWGRGDYRCSPCLEHQCTGGLGLGWWGEVGGGGDIPKFLSCGLAVQSCTSSPVQHSDVPIPGVPKNPWGSRDSTPVPVSPCPPQYEVSRHRRGPGGHFGGRWGVRPPLSIPLGWEWGW